MPPKKITPDMFPNFKEIEGFDGPYRNQYLKGTAPGAGIKKFETLEEAVEAARRNPHCGGITVSRLGYYTLRKKSNLYNSNTTNRFTSIEVTYVKIEDVPSPVEPPKLVESNPYFEILEINKVRKDMDKGSVLEKIKLKNQDYYYNIPTRKIYDLNGFLKGKLEKGRFISI